MTLDPKSPYYYEFETGWLLDELEAMSAEIADIVVSLELHPEDVSPELRTEDARNQCLGGLQQLITGQLVVWWGLMHGRTKSQLMEAVRESARAAAEGRTPEQLVADNLYALEATARLGFLTLFYFQVDALFQNLLHALGEPVTMSFYRNTERLLGALDIPNPNDELETVAVGSTIRNSQHSGGIHSHAGWSKTIGGLEFDFVEGRVCTCAGWKHVIVACFETLRVVGVVLHAPDIRSLQSVSKYKMTIPL